MAETVKVIGHSVLSGKTKYSYCPKCYRELKGDTKALSPLQTATLMYIWQDKDGKERKAFDTSYKCDRCGHKYMLRDLEDCYIAKREKKDAT